MRTYGLIGKSLGHSWSRDYFEAKFIRENLPGCNYKNFQIKDISFVRPLIHKNPAIAGLNVTIPYKYSVIKFLDGIDNDASRIGAVNCIKLSRTWQKIVLTGYNTDCPAFRNSVAPLLHNGVKSALILGTGGAAKAVAHALHDLGIGYRLVSRKPGSGNLTYSDLTDEAIRSVQLIVNATPAGMHGHEAKFPEIPYEAICREHILFDLVYNPAETDFLMKGRQAGAAVKNGMEMLVIQAELSWEIWNQ